MNNDDPTGALQLLTYAAQLEHTAAALRRLAAGLLQPEPGGRPDWITTEPNP